MLLLRGLLPLCAIAAALAESRSAVATGTKCTKSAKHAEEPAVPVVTCDQLDKHFADNEPLETDSRPGKVARRMCRKHQQDVCALPKTEFMHISAASSVYIPYVEYPHMALLGYGDRDSVIYSCGGSLISESYVLTSALCARLKNGDAVRWVVLGATKRQVQKPGGSDARQLIEVAEVITHPQYAAGVRYHDIALLRLATPAKLHPNGVRPACLNTDVDRNYSGKAAFATAWDTGVKGSETIVNVNLTVHDLQHCRDNSTLDPKELPRGLEDTQLCVGTFDNESDTCKVQSGGPLQVHTARDAEYSCMYRLLGVVAAGAGSDCGPGRPAIYTRVAAYVDWIESIVWPTGSDGCRKVVPPTSASLWDQKDFFVANTGPGSMARGMCRVYHSDLCSDMNSESVAVKPELNLESACHHNRPSVKWSREMRPTSVVRYNGTQGDEYFYNKQYSCAGALISPNAILTAARCKSFACQPIHDVYLIDPLLTDHIEGLWAFKVESVHVHPEYRSGEAYADLAIVKLTKSVDLRTFQPLCLDTPAHGEVRPGTRAKAAGWNVQGEGWTGIQYEVANTSLTVRGADECSSALLANEKLREAHPKGFLPSQICAGGLCDNETYGGEYGVPLSLRTHTLRTAEHGDFPMARVLGVASSLSYCTARTPDGSLLPDLFTSAASHLAWIESVVWPEG
ncbi:hypothetical protein ONE63_001690 [Megalurothrips usitatus]|uniref:Peptidase S1 domain-containing protein n=1 Tax=Megalurothrips usitatus TaxID=439358 RepID=A0AAV7XDA4_9NEOP|nr:hypothetical protein ONE63_001690 [Megalurothrips usitatus]